RGRPGVHETPRRGRRRRGRPWELVLVGPRGRQGVRPVHVLEAERDPPGGRDTPSKARTHVMGGADLVLVDGQIHTMDPASPHAKGIAFGGGRILAVGTNAQAEKWTGKGTELIELDGKVVVPGFIDAHAHLMESAAHASNPDLGGCASLASAL